MMKLYLLELYGLSAEGRAESPRFLYLKPDEQIDIFSFGSVKEGGVASHFASFKSAFELGLLFIKQEYADEFSSPCYSGFNVVEIEMPEGSTQVLPEVATRYLEALKRIFTEADAFFEGAGMRFY